jgi:hypothetical protein
MEGINEMAAGFSKDTFIKLFLRLGLFLIFVQVAFLLINFNNLPSQVPLFYSLPWGEKRLASYKLLFILPVLSIIILVINYLISKRVYEKERLLSRISLMIGLINVVLSVIALFQIIIVVT